MAEGGNKNNSVQTVVTSLIYNGLIFVIFIGVFICVRGYNPRVYDMRSYSQVVAEGDRPRPLKKGAFAWVTDLLTRSDDLILRDAGMDGYFFLRYLRMLFFVAVGGIFILLPILLPVDATNGAGNQGLDLLAFGNITNNNRYFAHVFLSWIFFGLVLFYIYREMLFYVSLRQAVLTSESNRGLLSNRTVVVSSVPDSKLNEEYMRSVFHGVKYVFIPRNAKELTKAVEERNKLAAKLEAAENAVIKKATKKYLKVEKKGGELKDDIWAYTKKPTFRLGKIPLIGQKVETIAYAKKQLPVLERKVEHLREKYHSNAKGKTAIIVFETQTQAETAVQMLAYHEPLQLSPRYIGAQPDEIVWENTTLTWWQRLVKHLGASAFCTALCIFWAIPVAFVGFISQPVQLIQVFQNDQGEGWMNWLLPTNQGGKFPGVLFGLISSLLPTILLAVLMMLVPPIIRKAAKISGCTSLIEVEYYTQNVFYAFQVCLTFLVVTLASSILQSLSSILADPGTVLNMLHQNLPGASNFFINWMLLQALTVPSGGLLQMVALILFHLLGTLLDNTPRKLWTRFNAIGGNGWGTTFPIYSTMATIMFTYSIIAPIIMPFAAVLFFFCYIAWINNLTFVTGKTNGRGIYYARGLNQLFVGIYLAEVILIVMFIFAKTWGPLVLEIVFTLFTLWFQLHLNEAFSPLLYSLPNSLLEGGDPFVDAPEEKKQTEETPAPTGGLVARFFKPHIFYTPENVAREMLTDEYWNIPPQTDDKDESTAYHNPAVHDPTPLVWFPEDPNGFAEEQLRELTDAKISASISGARWEIAEKKNKKKAKMVVSQELSENPLIQVDQGNQPPRNGTSGAFFLNAFSFL